ncbi:Gti1/Pac2 family-domain-containing protein [Xylaria grammica]|nr:Gti1/Pac2 family-domain-containing protein [Xylaria grammica]
MANQTPPGGVLYPTFQGFISSTMDALILFEACLSGPLQHVSRRPHDRERSQLIRSGNVFIYEEHSSGIKRWTDGVPWSPSRILGNFLLYRELDKPFQPGEKKRAMKRNKTDGGVLKAANPRANSMSAFGSSALTSSTTMTSMENTMNGNDMERAYIGSLVDSYQFKEHGLVKKTISVQHKGVSHHLVSYYSLEDIKNNRLKSVTDTPSLQSIVPRSTLLSCGSFRAPVDDHELVVDPSRTYVMPHGMGYNMGIDGLQTRSLSIPPTQSYGHPPAWGSAQHYGHSSSYLPQTMQTPATSYAQQMVPTYAYDSTYGPSRPPNYSSMMQTARRHSVVPNTNSTTELGYPSTLLANGAGLTSHGLSPNYGDMFNASAANAVTESTPTNNYSAGGTVSQANGTHNIGSSISHTTTGFDNQLSNGYENSMNRLQINDYGDTLQDSTGPNFSSTSTSTTPTNLPIGGTSTTPTNLSMSVDHSELSSAEHEWNRTGQIIPKREGDW